MKGIDVAKWNLQKDEKENLISLDWNKIKLDGVKFVIIKAINKKCVKEDAFDLNYNGAISVDIPIDVYNYSYATNVKKAESDAKAVLSVIKGKKIETVWLDIEDKCQINLGMTLINIINAYKKIIEDAGFKFGVYTGLSFYNSFIKPFHDFIDCEFWIARYPNNKEMTLNDELIENKKPVILHELNGWQYSSKGRVKGIRGYVDLNVRYEKKEGNLSQSEALTGIFNYSLEKDGEESISKNFKVKEFRCKDGSDSIFVDVNFVRNYLQKIRDYFNSPLTINSAYRTEEYNKKVGGAKNSYHMKGQAFDIAVKGHTPTEVAQYAQTLGIKGIIQYNTFVHVDSRTRKYWSKNKNGKISVVKSF